MDFISLLKEKYKDDYRHSYEHDVEICKNTGCSPESFEEYLEGVINQRINCGGYAFEIDCCIFKGKLDFERTVSAILEALPFARLLGNTNLEPDEYIVKYRATPSFGHHFIKIQDGKATEKHEAGPVQDFTDWPEGFENLPEATFAVKKEHSIFAERWSLLIDSGKNFDDTVDIAYKNQQDTFSYHSHNYSFKRNSATGKSYIYSDRLRVAEFVVEDDECIAIIRNGYEEFVSNTKTDYHVGPSHSLKTSDR